MDANCTRDAYFRHNQKMVPVPNWNPVQELNIDQDMIIKTKKETDFVKLQQVFGPDIAKRYPSFGTHPSHSVSRKRFNELIYTHKKIQ